VENIPFEMVRAGTGIITGLLLDPAGGIVFVFAGVPVLVWLLFGGAIYAQYMITIG
jgi:hypothetical protein